MKKEVIFLLIFVFLLGCARRQIPRQRPEMSLKQKEARYKMIERFVMELGKKRQRKECLSFEVSTAEQAVKCFACHDLWKKWEEEQRKK